MCERQLVHHRESTAQDEREREIEDRDDSVDLEVPERARLDDGRGVEQFGAEIWDAMLVASISRMNWLASAGNISFSAGRITM